MARRPSDQSEEQRHLILDGAMLVENMIDARQAAQTLGCSPDDVLPWRRRGDIEGSRGRILPTIWCLIGGRA